MNPIEFFTIHNKMEEFVNSGKSISFTSKGLFLTPESIWFNPIGILHLMTHYKIEKPESYENLIQLLDEHNHLIRASNKTDFFRNPLYTTRTLYREKAGWRAKIASVLTNRIIA
jgi:hypothetical protein